ncbi:hypothetical protein [Streptomyces phaeoluteigriseus]
MLPAATGGPGTADTLLVGAYHPSWKRAQSAIDLTLSNCRVRHPACRARA